MLKLKDNTKAEYKSVLPETFKNKLNISDIEKLYLSKMSNKNLIGLEYERLSLDKNTLKNAKYSTMEKIIRNFAGIMSWELIYDDRVVIGAKDNLGTSISLEPGCQIELSLAPFENLIDIDRFASKILNLLDEIANSYGVIFLGYGISPVSAPDEIEIINKRRYQLMNNYLPYCEYGEFCPKMMRQTAGIQINVNFKSNSDAYKKLQFLNLIMPFMMGLTSNSPFENNKLTNFKSLRANSWLYTGKNRCNLFYKEIFKKFFNKKRNIFKNYINEILKVPMLYLERNNELLNINGEITFAQFMENGYNGQFATKEDYLIHQSLCFPDVRLKNYIEIRNHDSSSLRMALALCAMYKGLSSSNVDYLLLEFNFLSIDEIERLNRDIIIDGLNIEVKNGITGWNVVEKLFKIAITNLSFKEKIYIEPFVKIIKTRKTQADILQDNNILNAFELVEFINKYYKNSKNCQSK